MWTTVLITGLAAFFEPVRIAFAVLMVNRPRPMAQLLVFLTGGFAVCVGVGLVVLFILRATPLGAGTWGVAKMQIAAGLLVLLGAVALATNLPGRRLILQMPFRAAVAGESGVAVLERKPASRLQKLFLRARHLLANRSLWVPGAGGLLMLGSCNFWAAVAVILARRAAPASQAGALLTFNVLASSVIAIPLLAYLAAPHKVRRSFVSVLHARLQSRSRRNASALLAAVGCLLLTIGIIGL